MDYLVTFLLVATMDFFYAMYTVKASQLKKFQAPMYATLIFSITGFVTLAYVENPKLLPAAIIGAFVGTYIAIHKEEKRERQRNQEVGEAIRKRRSEKRDPQRG